MLSYLGRNKWQNLSLRQVRQRRQNLLVSVLFLLNFRCLIFLHGFPAQGDLSARFPNKSVGAVRKPYLHTFFLGIGRKGFDKAGYYHIIYGCFIRRDRKSVV